MKTKWTLLPTEYSIVEENKIKEYDSKFFTEEECKKRNDKLMKEAGFIEKIK